MPCDSNEAILAFGVDCDGASVRGGRNVEFEHLFDGIKCCRSIVAQEFFHSSDEGQELLFAL